MTDTPIPLARPLIGDEEGQALINVMKSGVLSRGRCLIDFELGMASLSNTGAGVGVNSGTTGLQIAMEALDVGPGDEVITPAFTFVGTVNAIVRTGAKPVLVDVDQATLNLDPERVREAIGPRTRAILVVHLFGRPAAMDEIGAIAQSHDLAVIEDACEAIGARYRDRPVGGLGDAGIFGFYPNKPIATGEGGMIVAHDSGLLTRCRQLRNQGVDPSTGTRHASLPGLSARLSELHAALGTVQLERLQDSLARRQAIADRYLEILDGHPRLQLPHPADSGDRIAWFTFPLRLKDASRKDRDRLIERMADQGIECGAYFEPVHRLPFHRQLHDGRSLPVSEDAGNRSLALPLYPGLFDDQVERICRSICEVMQ